MSRVWSAALALAVMFALAGSAAAQQPAPAAAGTPAVSILVVNVQQLLRDSKVAKMVRSQIEQKRSEYTKEISHQEERLRAERDALQRKQSSMSPDVLNQKGREFQQKVAELDRSVQAKREALEKSNAEALNKIQQQMLKIIAGIAKERKANLVLQSSQLVLFDKHFDVTDEVLKQLDQQMPTLTVNFVAPETPAKPAAAEHSRTREHVKAKHR